MRGQIATQTELVELDSLREYPGNARRGNVEVVRESLRAHGQYRPIVVQASTRFILAGNHTAKAAREEGWSHVLVTWVDVDDDAARKINLVDNRSNDLAGYDDEMLAQLLTDLGGDFDGTGFTHEDYSQLLDGLSAADPDDVPPVRGGEPRTEPGDIWQLGDHVLICGDALDEDCYAELLGDDRAALIVTSPPYNQQLDTFTKSGAGRKDPSWAKWVDRMAAAYGDNLPEDVYQDQQRKLFTVVAEAAADGASFFYNHKVRYREKAILHPFEWLPFRDDGESPWRLRQEIVWDRATTSLTFNARMFYPRDERLFWLTKGDEFYFGNTSELKAWGSVWSIQPRVDVGVSAPFPIELPRRPIMACSVRDDIVLDPYAGSGTTLIACETLGRRARAIELVPEYCDVIVERWENITGQKGAKL